MFFLKQAFCQFLGILAITAGARAAESTYSHRPGGFDYSVGAGVRTAPVLGTLSGKLGYSSLLWGNAGRGEYLYGYVRPSVRLGTSVIANQIEPAIEFFPISILGLSAGYLVDSRWVGNFAGGRTLGTAFVQNHLSLNVGRFYLTQSLRAGLMTPSENEAQFFDLFSNLVGRAGGDLLLTNEVAVSFALNDEWKLGALFKNERMSATGESNDSQLAFARWARGRWSVNVGTGAYAQTGLSRGFTTSGWIQWTGISSLALY